MSALTRRLLWLPRLAARWTSEHPFRAAGGVAAVAGLLAAVLSVDPPTVATPADLAGFAAAHPAYAAAIVVGLAVLLFAR